ncbi:MAG: hypothetical protein WA629_12355 [Candidatus Aquilonibacter sp.]
MKSQQFAAIVIAGLAFIALIGSRPLVEQHVLTAAVKDRVSLGDVDVYFPIAVFDPNVAEILAGHLMVGQRPMDLKVDPVITSHPAWSTAAPASPNPFDLTAKQLTDVEDGIKHLGFSENAVHGLLVTTNENAGGPTRFGEIFVNLGSPAQAPSALARLTADSSVTMARLEAQANVHIAYVGMGYFYRPDCHAVAQRIESQLDRRALDEKVYAENAIGYRLRLVSVDVQYPFAMLCPDLHPVNIGYTSGWTDIAIRSIHQDFRDLVISGIARYDIGTELPSRPSSSPPGTSIEGSIPNENWRPDLFAKAPTGRYVLKNANVTLSTRPDAALLAYEFYDIPQAQIDAAIARLHLIGIEDHDVFARVDSDATRVWIRFTPITLERAAQVDSVMTTSGQSSPDLAVFTTDCTGYGSAIAVAFQRAREQAVWSAARDSKKLGPVLSIAIGDGDDYPGANVTCGDPSTATTEQLARGMVQSEPFTRFTKPIAARFGARVDAVWPLK